MRRAVTTEQALIFAQRNKMFYLEISSKTGHNVEEAFYKMAFEVNETSRRSASSWSRESKTHSLRGSHSSSD